jgi:hypothetical protein
MQRNRWLHVFIEAGQVEKRGELHALFDQDFWGEIWTCQFVCLARQDWLDFWNISSYVLRFWRATAASTRPVLGFWLSLFQPCIAPPQFCTIWVTSVQWYDFLDAKPWMELSLLAETFREQQRYKTAGQNWPGPVSHAIRGICFTRSTSWYPYPTHLSAHKNTSAITKTIRTCDLWIWEVYWRSTSKILCVFDGILQDRMINYVALWCIKIQYTLPQGAKDCLLLQR